MSVIETLSANYPVVYTQNIPWGDMDAFGHVNNVNYYRYAESARIVYMDKLDIMTDKVHIVIFSSSCKYFSPVVYPDNLLIGTRITEMRNSSFSMVYEMYSEQQQKLVAKAEAVIVAIDSSTGIKCALPEDVRQKMIATEAEKGLTITQK